MQSAVSPSPPCAGQAVGSLPGAILGVVIPAGQGDRVGESKKRTTNIKVH
ncbi:MAG: hypothetical protein KAT07_12730 [Calditrichia bacterium]|nr:hypothetical protein [Calditrichia bacterium]